MAFASNGTKLANLVNPQVVADLLEKQLTAAIRFAPLCKIDTSLQGKAGDTLTIPTYAYIGDAADVAEGADIPVAQLSATSVDVKVKKAGKGVQISDEAVLSGYGDPAGEAVDQLKTSIASKVDADIIGVLRAIDGDMVYEDSGHLDKSILAAGLQKFGENIEGTKVLLCNSESYVGFLADSSWIPASEIAAEIVVEGAVGSILGCQVVISDRLTYNEAFVVKPGALGLLLKRDTLVETDRDIINKSTVMTADKHYAPYLYDASKAIQFKLGM
jgi:N4-gp56 family major capsid protein